MKKSEESFLGTQRFSIGHYAIEIILAWLKAGEIAIPEIQRPFIWSPSQVRDLIDSLYLGYPVGYIISWQNPNIKLKDGTIAKGKKILIDGQQRIVALTAAILGKNVVDKNYRRIRIKIAFNPLEEKFEVSNPALEKSSAWIPDISEIFKPSTSTLRLINEYCSRNQNVDPYFIEGKIERLKNIIQREIGFIELSSDLDIETVTEIFIRINSQGVALSQADFAMSKIASNETYGGSDLRKCIDYFCHLSVDSDFYSHITDIDKDFAKKDYFQKMSWLKNENDDLYDPKYSDMLRVAFTSEFSRGKLADLVSLLSGRNFETKTYEEEIAENSFGKLQKGVLNFINESNFKKFIMIIKSAGFVSQKLIRSKVALDFAYILYLKLKSQNYHPAAIGIYVRKWFVMSILTGRYSSSPESSFDFDIKNISTKDFKQYLKDVEGAELSDAFWNASLPQSLDTSVASSPYFNVYLAAQVKANDKGFLSQDITVNDLILHKGDIHHIFPKDYLKKHGLKRKHYNQIANYAYMQAEINIGVGNKSPDVYLDELKTQFNGNKFKYGRIENYQMLLDNLNMNCIPTDIFRMNVNSYEEFLIQRRKLITEKIRNYYLYL